MPKMDGWKVAETLKANPELMEKADESVYRLLMEKFTLGLFENPYVDADSANAKVGKAEYQQKADLAMRKSIVLLRNENVNNNRALPLRASTKIYFETYMQRKDQAPGSIFKGETNNWNVEFVDTPEAADVVLLWIKPKSKSLFESDGSPLYLSLSKNGVDVNYINTLIAKKPTILAINFTNPWVIDEIYSTSSKNIQGVLATFGTTPEALLDIITGRVNPSGKMPFTTPISENAAQNQKSDVPGNMEGPAYALFKFDEGLRYKH